MGLRDVAAIDDTITTAGTGVAQGPRRRGSVTRPAYSGEDMNPPHESAPLALLVSAGTPE